MNKVINKAWINSVSSLQKKKFYFFYYRTWKKKKGVETVQVISSKKYLHFYQVAQSFSVCS